MLTHFNSEPDNIRITFASLIDSIQPLSNPEMYPFSRLLAKKLKLSKEIFRMCLKRYL
jgi:hypothetical protein